METILIKKSSKSIQGNDFSHHPKARPVEAAVKATSKAIELALKYKKRLHVLHLSSAEEVKIIREHKSSNLITCETTPQHLLMKAPDIYKKIGAFAHSEANTSPTESNIKCSFSDGSLSGTKIAVVDGDVSNLFIVTANNGSGVGLYLVDGSSDGVEITTQPTLDPSRSHAAVSFNNASATELKSDWSDVLGLLDRAAVLFSFEQLGGAEACMDMAKEYAMGRYAFGRSIASFQAIKHKLADMFIAVELARSNCYYGAWALSTDAPELPTAAATCRVSASQAFHECSKENIQTHGGMGFTWEFDCHLYYRRCRQLAANIGSQAIWKDKLISSLERANQI